MKKAKSVICILLCMLLILQTACGNTDGEQGTGNNVSESEASGGIENGTDQTEASGDNGQLLHDDWISSIGEVTQTWQKDDYTSEEWEDGVCLNMYVHYPLASSSQIGMVEDELNHRLHQVGYDFYLRFIQPVEAEEFVGVASDTVIAQKKQSGMTLDMYMLYDYREALENGTLLDLTGYLQSEEGRNLYSHYDTCVWQQLADEDGHIYGIPTNPVAASRFVYAYNPQLADVLGIDMAAFGGDLTEVEAEFAGMLEQGIMPISLDCREDLWMLSLFGLENYKEIFAVRHTEDDWEAVDLFEEEEAISFYEQLGDWKEKGFLSYDGGFLRRIGSGAPSEMNSEQYDYVFLSILGLDRLLTQSFLNFTAGRSLETAVYVPQEQAFITENRNSGILVIDASTAYPQQCMQFLDLLSTDADMRMLLFLGIEDYDYMWQDDVCVHSNQVNGFVAGLGIDSDFRFWPVEHWAEKYRTDTEAMNRDVSEGISLTVDCDFAGLEEQYEACRQLFEDNILVFLGYYGTETGERLQALHEQLNEAGYQELVAAVNAMH